ncbi:(2Fe-2S)-binding protein [Kitasatospora sp. DSM 101779]|uniref:(2Fe-2S)-binding protein n=1 Tax=Kitasatospora sp. DSM 101779 TaxID=2853165 RepID=UPI0021D9A8A5|nr:(2Fe-2S)-binding protein [Kitasatospora sp. DSM 101779]MCU7821612.1 (2Fe-2S)-binding protein [Kitasatospora sp. DSM 101779]
MTVDRTPARLADATPGPGHTIEFDGRPVPALPGQSIAAALWADGVLAWRRTRVGGRPRGAFCGIGVCYDCLATVDGQPNRRTCLMPAEPGTVVTTQEGHGRADLAV